MEPNRQITHADIPRTRPGTDCADLIQTLLRRRTVVILPKHSLVPILDADSREVDGRVEETRG